MNKFIKENNFSNMHFLQNNSFVHEGTLICGTRGWMCPNGDGFTDEDQKILDREIQRLKLSLQSGIEKEHERLVVALHYPPFEKNKKVYSRIEQIFIEFGVDLCIYGHLHGPSQNDAFEGIENGIQYKFVSADYLGFMPYRLFIERGNSIERED